MIPIEFRACDGECEVETIRCYRRAVHTWQNGCDRTTGRVSDVETSGYYAAIRLDVLLTCRTNVCAPQQSTKQRQPRRARSKRRAKGRVLYFVLKQNTVSGLPKLGTGSQTFTVLAVKV